MFRELHSRTLAKDGLQQPPLEPTPRLQLRLILRPPSGRELAWLRRASNNTTGKPAAFRASLMAECKDKAIQGLCQLCRFQVAVFHCFPLSGAVAAGGSAARTSPAFPKGMLFDIFPLFRSRLEAATLSATAGRRSLLTFFRCRKKVSLGSGVKLPNLNMFRPKHLNVFREINGRDCFALLAMTLRVAIQSSLEVWFV
jgi:hypothetical protein